MTSPQAAAPARQRIAKAMARAGLCSRRDAEAWIVDGRVSVNGEVLTSPAVDVGPDDAVLVDGAPLPAADKTRLFLFHKPRGLVTSDRDPEGRATVADFLRANWPDGPRVVTVGRLDINTEGLLLLTNDGGLARVLELPKTGWVRRYRVRAKGETDQAVLDGLRDGVTIDGIDYAGIEAALDRAQGANTWLTMGLREGRNREVKRVLEHIGLEVNRLIRLSFGPFQLGDLAEGAVEEVRTRVLRDQLGAALAAAAGATFEEATPPRDGKPVRADPKQSRAAGAERANRGERPAPERRGERGRGGDRPLRRAREEPQPIRERPKAGPRKHVSTLRAEGTDMAQRGPRRRIERADVTDRRERSVKVERLIGVRPAPLEPTRTRGAPRTAQRDEAEPARPSGRRQGSGGGASPSALAKRARVARSGGQDDAGMPRPRNGRRAEAGRRADAREPDGDRRQARAAEKRFDGKRPRGGAPGKLDRTGRDAGSTAKHGKRAGSGQRRGETRSERQPAGGRRQDDDRRQGQARKHPPRDAGGASNRPSRDRDARSRGGERRTAPSGRPGAGKPRPGGGPRPGKPRPKG